MTGIRIWGLGWRYRYERTDPISVEELMAICKVGRSQLYGHLRRLLSTGVLRYTNTGGEFTFHFDRQAARIRAGPSPENRTGQTLPVVVDDSLFFDESRFVFSKEKEQQQQIFSSLEGGCGGEADESGKSDRAVREALDEMRVMEPVLSELAALSWMTMDYLLDWWTWYQLDAHPDLEIGFLITQFRSGRKAPRSWREG